MLVFLHRSFWEDYPESNGNYQCKTCKDIPAGLPAIPNSHWTCCNHRFCINEMVYNRLRCQRTNSSTKAVGHHHEQALCTRALTWVGLLIHIQRARDIEEVKSKAIDNAAQYEQYHAWHAWVTCTKESETQYPCQHCHQHHRLDTKLLQEEWDKQDTQCLTDL